MARSHRPTRFLALLVMILMAPAIQAGDFIPQRGNQEAMVHAAGPDPAKAERDTIILIGPWGSGAPVNGQFEDQGGWAPAWNGWTTRDETVPPYSRWSISDYQAANLGGHGPGNLAAWCGEDIYPSCSENDEPGGYGNNYYEFLGWNAQVADPTQPCTVTVTARLNLDSEMGYDFLSLIYQQDDNEVFTVWEEDGRLEDFAFSETFVIQPEDYQGGGALPDEVQLRFRFISDGAFSDQDCRFFSSGACQIDDISVSLSNGNLSTLDDFDSGEWTSWSPVVVQGVGDFTHLMTNLQDIDPCVSNYSAQVVFIDDGYVIPETGGQACINWCYGPGGYIVNTRGGLQGPDSHIWNRVMSPVIPWPAAGAEGALFSFDVYEHEDLSADAPGMFHMWDVRSVANEDPATIESARWESRNFVYYGPPGYIRQVHDVSSLIVPGARFVQVSLVVRELGYYWDWVGDDGYPAPYFDNVRLVAFPHSGPQISVRHLDLAQDGFPAQGYLDVVDEGSNSVRFDMAQNIAMPIHERIDPGDSIVADVNPLRLGAELVGMPRLHYRLQANPAFADHRTSGLPPVGMVEGSNVIDGIHTFVDRFAFDLPDTGFLFPGDILHYYLEATSTLAGDLLTTTMPADTTGFSDFSDVLSYDPVFTVRALPSVQRNGYTQLLGNAPRILLWDDGKDLETWINALEGMDLNFAEDYDVFSTRSPSSGVGNGLGSRATPELMDHYRTLLYSSGTLGVHTLCDGDFSQDGSDDLGLLDAWLNQGERSLLVMGDQLVGDLTNSSMAGQEFRDQWLAVEHVGYDLRPLIGGQSAPAVRATANEVFTTLPGWVAYGGCPAINAFDALVAVDPAQRAAEFTDPAGQMGVYPYAAVAIHDLPESKTVIPDHNSAVVTVPFDLQFIFNDPSIPPGGPYPARQDFLFDILYFFGEIIIWGDSPLPENGVLSAANYPNPFNPVTRIDFNLPRAGRVTVKVFDARGRLVAKVLDDTRQAGSGQAIWNGKDGNDQAVASGLYFYEVKAGGQSLVNKMMLLK